MTAPVEATLGRRRAGYGLALLAMVTCPCHLPILALSLAGTAAGAVLASNFAVVLVLLVLLFSISVVAAIRLLSADVTEHA